jgi:acetyl-CoA carboxylase biotin carboxyl carrier protein
MNHEQIEAMVGVLTDSPRLTELEVRAGDVVLRLRRPAPPETARPRAAARSTPAERNGDSSPASAVELSPPPYPAPVLVTALIVGVFHAQKPPVKVDDAVKEKQVLGQIEAMRLMNDCAATQTGRVVAVLVSDGQPVEYGQPLFEIVPEEV